jgi:hypothetical protein
MRWVTCFLATLALALMIGATALADVFFFTTGDPDYRLAAAVRVPSKGLIEIEAADDFILDRETVIWHASFRGLLPPEVPLSDVSEVVTELYRVFPLDSDTERQIQVPTRVNSPSDNAFTERESFEGELFFEVTLLNSDSGADNSVVDGIFPEPDQMTGGEGPVAGQEILIDVYYNLPLNLPAGHYFIIPQVLLDSGGTFLWLSAPHPQFTGDLQMWIRNSKLDPDWLRVGTDIVGGTTFNGSFTLVGETIGP